MPLWMATAMIKVREPFTSLTLRQCRVRLGYATANGVSRLRAGFASDEGFVVRALEDVAAGQTDRFEEVEKKTK